MESTSFSLDVLLDLRYRPFVFILFYSFSLSYDQKGTFATKDTSGRDLEFRFGNNGYNGMREGQRVGRGRIICRMWVKIEMKCGSIHESMQTP